MRKEIADLWVEALDSGRFEQAAGALVQVDAHNGEILGHCCLGVLCELAVEAGVRVERTDSAFIEEHPDEGFYTTVGFDGSMAVLPDSVMEWAEIESCDGRLSGGTDLAALNDSGTSFAEIAEIIRTNYGAL